MCKFSNPINLNKKFNYIIFVTFDDRFVAGHYSQVVWADSYAVGCGITTCKSGWSPIYACNYGTPGNYVGSAMYKSGKAATACPSGTKPSNSLCA